MTYDLSQPHMTLNDVRKILLFGHPTPIYEPSEKAILFYQRAFVHRSIPEETKRCAYDVPLYMKKSNETMEVVGDVLFSAAITLYLENVYRDKNEGELSKMRSRIVQGKTMASVAKTKMDLGKYILVAPSVSEPKKNEKFLENCFEAFVCAVHADVGFEGVCKFAFSVLRNCISEDTILKNTNYKDTLIHFAKAFDLDDLEFSSTLIDKMFSVTVTLGGETYGPKVATRKRDAEQSVSKLVIDLLEVTEDLINTQRHLKRSASKKSMSPVV